MSILAALWGRTAAMIVGVVGVAAALFGIRRKIRRGAQEEMSYEIQARTLDQIRKAQQIEREHGDIGRDDVIDRLREQGHLRE